jgi:hypothetical protein
VIAKLKEETDPTARRAIARKKPCRNGGWAADQGGAMVNAKGEWQ